MFMLLHQIIMHCLHCNDLLRSCSSLLSYTSGHNSNHKPDNCTSMWKCTAILFVLSKCLIIARCSVEALEPKAMVEKSRALDFVGQCTVCTDIITPNMELHQEHCGVSRLLLKLSCGKSNIWKDNHYCQLSCFLAGYGYPNDKCCEPSAYLSEDISETPSVVPSAIPSWKPSSVPSQNPSLAHSVDPSQSPSNKPSSVEELPNNSSREEALEPEAMVEKSHAPDSVGQCTVCTDIISPKLEFRQEHCGISKLLLMISCGKSNIWKNNHYCQLSCFLAGYGYPNDKCCEPSAYPSEDIHSVDPSQSLSNKSSSVSISDQPSSTSSIKQCIACSNIETPHMVNNDEHCEISTYLLGVACNKHDIWTSNKYCQLSCFRSGNGYKGDKCCEPSE